MSIQNWNDTQFEVKVTAATFQSFSLSKNDYNFILFGVVSEISQFQLVCIGIITILLSYWGSEKSNLTWFLFVI